MKCLGLDIGTTTVSAVVVDGAVLVSRTRKSGAFRETPRAYEKLQAVAVIRDIALETVDELLALHPDVAAIGVTGQMHGILYLNGAGDPVSDLITWQDGRGDLPFREGHSYAEELSRLTGHRLATGYGMVTHFYNLQNGLVPEGAAVFCTVQDYLAMLLSGRTRPLTEASDAASLGLFDVRASDYDGAALTAAGIDRALLPALAENPLLGYYRGIPVFVAIGDNQASFLGAVDGNTEAMLVNVGTGSQFSVYTKEYLDCPGLETRPFPGGGYLLVGAPLCGGRAYALLERFFRETVCLMTGQEPADCYAAMQAALDAGLPEDPPMVVPLFQGTREDPALRGSILALGEANFTPRHLILGLLEGMAAELYGLYLCYSAAGGSPAPLIGAGNGLRQNPHLRSILSRLFSQPLPLSPHTEEAAVGAALSTGMRGDAEDARLF